MVKMSSPLTQPKTTLKKKTKDKEGNPTNKEIVYDAGPAFPRTCFFCGHRYPQVIPNITREIVGQIIQVRTCPSCRINLQQFVIGTIVEPQADITEGHEQYKESYLMHLTKKEMVLLMREHGL